MARMVRFNANLFTDQVLCEVAGERAAQNAKWGEQNHPDGTGRTGDAEMADLHRANCQANGPEEDNWRDILQEEVAEAFAEPDPAKLRAELVQVAAVATAWVEAIDRRLRRNVHCSNCGDTRGGPPGHEASECKWNSNADAILARQKVFEAAISYAEANWQYGRDQALVEAVRAWRSARKD